MINERGAVGLASVAMTLIVLIALLALAPILATFTGMIASIADPFSKLLLELVQPLLFVFLLFSVGRSAQRSG